MKLRKKTAVAFVALSVCAVVSSGTIAGAAPRDEHAQVEETAEDTSHYHHDHPTDGPRDQNGDLWRYWENAHGTYGWTPSEYDSCPASLHDQFTVIGPDGNRYDGWHPTTMINPETGKECTFGHEHGDDPESSDIYDWVVEQLGSQATGIPFGYANEASAVGAAADGGIVHRHEDHVGHKVIVRNDVKQILADRSGYARDANGEPIVCDYLMKMHQGTHSPDATKNNAHELLYGAKCSDGTELVTFTITPLGQPNQFHPNCDAANPVQTEGSNLPGTTTGARRIPTDKCLAPALAENPTDVWAFYELWETHTELRGPSGDVVAFYDPWFGVRNPSRYVNDGNKSAVVDLYSETLQGWPWNQITAGMSQYDPASPLNGAQRDVYIGDTRINNSGGAEYFYTDAFGGRAAHEPFPGSIRQYVATRSNMDMNPVERRAFGFNTDYGPKGSGVHAPN